MKKLFLFLPPFSFVLFESVATLCR